MTIKLIMHKPTIACTVACSLLFWEMKCVSEAVNMVRATEIGLCFVTHLAASSYFNKIW